MTLRPAFVLCAVLGTAAGGPRAAATPATLRLSIVQLGDADVLVRQLSKALPIAHRYYDAADEVLRVVNSPPPIEIELPARASAADEAVVGAVVRGERPGNATFAIDFRATSVTVTRAAPAPTAVPSAPRLDADPWTGKTKPTTHQQFPDVTDRTWDNLPAGRAPVHINYFIVHWNPFRDIATNASGTIARAAARGLLTEPSFSDLLADDRLVPVPQRAAFTHEFENLVQAGVTSGGLAKTIVWRSDDVAAFEALKKVRTTAYRCAKGLAP